MSASNWVHETYSTIPLYLGPYILNMSNPLNLIFRYLDLSGWAIICQSSYMQGSKSRYRDSYHDSKIQRCLASRNLAWKDGVRNRDSDRRVK